MDLTPDLGRITAPTLVISGADDPATPPDHGRLIAKAIPGADFELVPAAHLLNIEQTDAVTRLLLAHLAPPASAQP
jgi:3-oxoadipate enol-lactonase